MDWDQAIRILSGIEEAVSDDPHGLRQDLICRAIRYARLRSDWQVSTPEARQKMDAERTAAHNTFIDACNILTRDMQRQGLDIAWRAHLGEDRKEIGDFACYLHCILGLRAR